MSAVEVHRSERYPVTVDQFTTFLRQGFLVVRGLVARSEVEELAAHTREIISGRLAFDGTPGAPTAARHSGIVDPALASEIERRYVRIHMLHRLLPIHERFLLHPRVLDVVGALIGPDVMAMQTMLFLKPPGSDGQGYHQDSYYIPTLPDSLCGAWLAIDRADPGNGCLHFAVGSQHEPIYPDADNRASHYPAGELAGLQVIAGASDTDRARNGLTAIADRYEEKVVEADPGDVVFFGGHVIHWSWANRSAGRFRRAFVSHYANARAFTQWGGGNAAHILARGRTHLPYAQPKFGTICAANQPSEPEGVGNVPTMMAEGGMMVAAPTEAGRLDPDGHTA